MMVIDNHHEDTVPFKQSAPLTGTRHSTSRKVCLPESKSEGCGTHIAENQGAGTWIFPGTLSGAEYNARQ